MAKEKSVFLNIEQDELNHSLANGIPVLLNREIMIDKFLEDPASIVFRYAETSMKGDFQIVFRKGPDVLVVEPEFTPGDILWVKQPQKVGEKTIPATQMKKEDAQVWLQVVDVTPAFLERNPRDFGIKPHWVLTYRCNVLSTTGKPEVL